MVADNFFASYAAS